MDYKITNIKENKEEVAFAGSTQNEFITTSIEFDIVVMSSGLEFKQRCSIPPILPTDFNEYVDEIAISIGKAMDKTALDKKKDLPADIIDFKSEKVEVIKRNIRR